MVPCKKCVLSIESQLQIGLENKQKALIGKYLEGKCSPEELEELKKVMLLPNSMQLFDEVISTKFTGLEAEGDTDQAALNRKLKHFYQRLEKQQSHILIQEDATQGIRKSILRRKYFYHAAIWAALILGIGWYGASKIMRQHILPNQEVVQMRELNNPKGQRSAVKLPDGSEVYLGADSKLSIPQKFTGLSREVRLEGEAFFEVAKNPQKPFIIHTGTVQTRVLGTSFKIEAFKGQQLRVSVATGKVRVDDYSKGVHQPLAILTPGQLLDYTSGAAQLTTVNVEELNAWKKARLSFHNQSLGEITKTLERWYDVSVHYKNKAKAAEKISLTLQADLPLNKVVKVLAATAHFKYEINKNNISIY